MMGRIGYVTGEKGLLMKTTNGGAAWKDISLNIKYKFIFIYIYYTGLDHLFATETQ